MMKFDCDYMQGAHPAILEKLNEINKCDYPGYGLDEWCRQAAKDIHKYLNCPGACVHFLVGGTQMNAVAMEAMLHAFQSVISADSGHIAVHESGAIENTGHKVHIIPAADGKLTAAQIRENAAYYIENDLREHMTQPRAVYLSFPTEYGTLYSKQELEDIAEVCREYNMFLYIDGARMGYGLTSEECDVTLEDLARLTDAFYIGGTKCGSFMGEAFVTTHPMIKDHFRNYMKMNGALLAKGWLLGVQFHVLMKDGLYFDICRKANIQARKIQEAFESAGVEPYVRSQTNQLFYIIKKRHVEELEKICRFELDHWIDDENALVRFCTSWSTSDEEVNKLIEHIRGLA
ncbi:MAG: beta-eliminating lyase-related protein [Bacillota bacterium]|nr:beta-eliminating lyase-related protein [Bacillota bacterium]